MADVRVHLDATVPFVIAILYPAVQEVDVLQEDPIHETGVGGCVDGAMRFQQL